MPQPGKESSTPCAACSGGHTSTSQLTRVRPEVRAIRGGGTRVGGVGRGSSSSVYNGHEIIISSSSSNISGNNGQVFERLDSGVLVAGCYNGGGIGLATMFGEQMAHMACGQMTDEITMIEARPKPNLLPAQLILGWGVRMRLIRDRVIARNEN